MATGSYRYRWLLSAAGLALGLGLGSAHAQQTGTSGPAPAPQAEPAGDVIQVTGFRPQAESQAAALEIQRQSDSVVSVLSADAIGTLPDQNLAFAVGRLPGIGIERDQGQARYVNLRGTPNFWTTLSFDGVPIVSPEGRRSRFDNIPSALASQVVVAKAITPNMPGDTVAGNINVITRSPFDHDGLYINGKAALGYVTLGGGEEVDTNIVVSNQFLGGRLGILAQASYYRRNMVTDNQETDPFLPITAATGTTINFAREFEHKPYRLTRENQSLSFRADYRLDDLNTFFWNNAWTNYTDEELRNNYIFRLDRGTGPTGAANSYQTTAFGNNPIVGQSFGAEININTNSLESEEDIYTSTIGGDHEDLAGFKVNWRANYTYTADGRDAPALPNWVSPSTFTDRPTVAYDFRDPANNQIQLFRTTGTTTARTVGARANSVQDFPWNFVNISRRVGGDETQAATLIGDVTREFDFGLPVELQAGFMYTDRIKRSTQRTWTATRAQLVTAGVAIPEITATGPNAAWNSLFLNKAYLANFPLNYNFQYHSKTSLEAFALDLQNRGIATRALTDDQNSYWKVGEEIIAGYLMGKVELDWGSIVGGVRAEQFTNTGAAIATVASQRRFINTESDDTLLYPSVHVNWDINDEMKLRVGLTTSASRPDFNNLRPNVVISDVNRTISGGNPAAEPEKQQGIDVYYEWYMQPEGFLSAGVFYKDISDFLFTELRAFGSDSLNSDGIDRSSYTFSGIQNGGDGSLQGFEIYYNQSAQDFVTRSGLPDWLGGFGTSLSATFVTSEVNLPAIVNSTGVITRAARDVRLPGTSGQIYNAQISYEKYNLSVRLAYQWRNAWIQGLGQGPAADGANGDTYWDDDEEVDLSIRYKLSDNLEWFFDAANITDAKAQRYRGQDIYSIETEQFGERYIMGLRFNY
jgi:TonB-dependent receptor